MLLPAWAKSQPTALVRHRCPAEECECRFGSHGSWETGQLSNFTSQNWSNIWMSSVKSSLRSFLHDFAWASPKGSWTAGSFGNRRIQNLEGPARPRISILVPSVVTFGNVSSSLRTKKDLNRGRQPLDTSGMSTPGLLRCEGSGVEWNQTLLLRSAWINPTYRNCLSRHGTTLSTTSEPDSKSRCLQHLPKSECSFESFEHSPREHALHIAVVVLVVLLIQGLNSDSFTADLRLIARPVLSGRRFRPWGRSSATGPMPWGWRLQSDWKEGLFSEKSHVCNEEHLGPLLYIYTLLQ